MSALERRYRRLLACYPRDHRERHGEEMLDVLLAGAGERTRPGWRETADLLWAATRLHLRRVVAADGGVNPGDVLAIVSLLGPLALLAGAARSLHEVAWWVRSGDLWSMPWWNQVPDAPVWGMWVVVAVLALFGERRSAAVGAWLGTAGFVAVEVFPATYQRWWTGADAGWVLLGALTAVALTWSPGLARGRELAGRFAVLGLSTTVVAAGALVVFGHGVGVAEWAWVGVLVVGTVGACAPWSRVGRRAALVLLTPVMTMLLANVVSSPLPKVAELALFFGVPLVVLLAVGGLPRRVVRGSDAPAT